MRGLQPPLVRPVGIMGPSAAMATVIIAGFVLPISLVPSSRGFYFSYPLLPAVWWKTNLVVPFAVIALLVRPIQGSIGIISHPTLRWFLFPFLFLGFWQILSLFWNDQNGYMKSYSLVQSIYMLCAITGAVLITSGRAFLSRIELGKQLVFILAFIFSVYLGLSFVFPSWRPSSAFMDHTASSLGFIRMFGPLGKSTTLLLILLPCLGFCIGMLSIPGRSKLLWMLMSGFFIFATFATGSRGSVLCLGAFVLCLMAALRHRAIWFVFPSGLVVLLIVAVFGVPERFQNFEDQSRFQTYATALRAFSASAEHVAFGTGHGQLYSTLHDNTERKMLQRPRWYLLDDRNEYGYTLRSSHTAILRPLAETGIIGFTFASIPLVWILKRLLLPKTRIGKCRYGLHATCALSGCAATIPYLALDEFFVSSFWVVVLWCTFVVIAAESQWDADMARQIHGPGMFKPTGTNAVRSA